MTLSDLDELLEREHPAAIVARDDAINSVLRSPHCEGNRYRGVRVLHESEASGVRVLDPAQARAEGVDVADRGHG